MKTKTLFAATLLTTLTLAAVVPALASPRTSDLVETKRDIIELQQAASACPSSGFPKFICRILDLILNSAENEAALEATGPGCGGGGSTPRVAGGHGQWGTTGFSAKKWCN